MTYSQAKIDAYEQLEVAIANIRNVYREENQDTPDMLTGWVVLTSAIEFKEPDTADLNQDDADAHSSSGWYARRGQDPTLSYGIVNEGLRHYNEVQIRR